MMQRQIKWHKMHYYSWLSKAEAKMLVQIFTIRFFLQNVNLL